MNTTMLRALSSLILAGLTLTSATAQQEVEILPSKDNTLYESSTGSASNGAGDFLFFGQTNQMSVRRALIQFDVGASIPAGAMIQSVVLQITVSKTISGPMTVTSHRVLKDWGEGTSDATGNEGSGTAPSANDATWIHSFFDGVTWEAPGGDYDAAVLSSTVAGGGGTVAFPSTPELVAVVQSWLDSPDENHGVILIGNENAAPSAKRIGSREGTEANRPKLVVTYALPTGTERNELPEFLTALDVYPNPATASATIRYTLSESRDVRIDVLDVAGRLVSRPVWADMPAGSHAGRIERGTMAPGVYLVRLVSGPQSASTVVVLQ